MTALYARELGWFEEADEKVLGVLIHDMTDNDYGYCILGRDAKSRYRAVSANSCMSTAQEAHIQLEAQLAEHAQMPPAEFHQGDEASQSLDFLTPLVNDEKQHPTFRTLSLARGFSPARSLLAEMMHYFEDIDGNFVQQFQSSGCDARVWELYLYALFTELGYGLDREHTAPDFHCRGLLGEFFVEATTINPSTTPPTLDPSTQQAYVEHYVPRKFGSVLFSKLNKTHQGKRYWELPHVVGHPFVIAVQDFHAPMAMAWSSPALTEYLYGLRQIERREPDGSLKTVSEQVKSYTWEGKQIPAGFFLQPDSENISAVLANPSGTLSKFNRMGFLAGFGDRDIRIIRKGICYRDSLGPQPFHVEVHSDEYNETWCEGLCVYHNPRAKQPLPMETFPCAAHCFQHDENIVALLPEFHPLGSLTFNVGVNNNEDQVQTNK
jgi:hypothetical protein